MIKRSQSQSEFLHLRNKLHVIQRYYYPDGKRLQTCSSMQKKAIRNGKEVVAFRGRLRVQVSPHPFVLSFLADKSPKSRATCAAMVVICSWAGGMETQRSCQKSKWARKRWLQGGGRVLGQMGLRSSSWPPPQGRRKRQMQAEVKSHWLIQTVSKVAFHSAVAVSPSADLFWWHLMEKVILSLIGTVWTSYNTGTKDTLYS